MKIYTVKPHNINNSPAFGWHEKTHSKMVKAVIGETGALKKFSKVLQDFVQRPDFDEKGLFYNSHFYYAAKNKTSFLNFDGKSNALDKYLMHLGKMFDSLRAGNDLPTIQEAGRALHFLQDVSQPQHVAPTNAVGKFFVSKRHILFENIADTNFKAIKHNYIPQSAPGKIGRSFEELFFENVAHSKGILENETLKKGNYPELARKSVLQGLRSTSMFLGELFGVCSEQKLF